MSTAASNPIPTKLNIAPRGKTWKNWQLVDGTDGFPTRESMEKYHCNPERVQSLEEERLINLETIDRLNALLEKTQCQGCPVQQGTHVPMGAVVHPDDLAVDALAAAMKAKLARQRAKGYGGWDTDCTQQRLSDLLRGHVDKGDPVDVANFCAFLLARGEGIAAAQQGKFEMHPLYTHPTQQGLDADMFWDADDTERCETSIDNVVVEVDSYRGLKVGDTVTIQRAKSLPDLEVRVTQVPDTEGNGDLEWAEIVAAQAKQGDEA